MPRSGPHPLRLATVQDEAGITPAKGNSMSNVYAFTAMGAKYYPEFISVNETDDPDLFTITVRSKEVVRDSEYICGYAADEGKPGRCTPGDEHCNNYCNMAPEKGPMADAPMPCSQTTEGSMAVITLTMAQMEELAGAIIRANTGKAV
jgi:hypothetical protein